MYQVRLLAMAHIFCKYFMYFGKKVYSIVVDVTGHCIHLFVFADEKVFLSEDVFLILTFLCMDIF